MFLKSAGILVVIVFVFGLISFRSVNAGVSAKNKNAAVDTLENSGNESDSEINEGDTEEEAIEAEEDSIVEVHLDANGKVEYTITKSGRFDSLLNAGKSEFSKTFERQNYAIAVKNLEEAVLLQPENTEARYFLGYAYSRLITKDGATLNKTSREFTIKSSEQFETVIKSSPKYKGEMLALDPYSKLTAEWGSLAMSYLYVKNKDSASWAFNEGKKRGGFGEFFLALNRLVLDNCPKNAILISNGDNFTIPLWYLQFMEQYRTDVTIVDINLLNTKWYPDYLKTTTGIFSSLSKDRMNAMTTRPWKDSLITIQYADNRTFSWVAKTYEGEHDFNKGDFLLLALITENKFKREICFTIAFPEYSRLNLADKLKKYIIVDKLNYDNSPQSGFSTVNTMLTAISSCFKYINTNSQLESTTPDMIRYEIIDLVRNCLLYTSDAADE
jgi:hypothetical protein